MKLSTMGLQSHISWYQKKIGTYDKEQWEQSVEEKVLKGFTYKPLKSTKIKTDLIDVDLVRGSSFPKSKAQFTFITATRLGAIKLFFMPLYFKWWIKHTSGAIFKLVIFIYLLQIINFIIYARNEENTNLLCEIITPAAMMLILSILQSQIVSTIQGTRGQSKHLSNRYKKRRKLRVTRKPSCDSKASYSSGGSFNRHYRSLSTKRVRIDTEKPSIRTVDQNQPVDIIQCANRNPIDDDGFESLNGLESSENGDLRVNAVGSSHYFLNESLRNRCHKSNSSRFDTKLPKSLFHRRYLTRRSSAPDYSKIADDSDSDSDGPKLSRLTSLQDIQFLTIEKQIVESSGCDSETEMISSPETGESSVNLNDFTTPEWAAATTNSEDVSYSSDCRDSDDFTRLDSDYDSIPTIILSPTCNASDKVSCTLWTKREIKKADLSVLDISSAIIEKVESIDESLDYVYMGIFASIFLASIPLLCRFFEHAVSNLTDSTYTEILLLLSTEFKVSVLYVAVNIVNLQLSGSKWIVLISFVQRMFLAGIFFFHLAIAERTFKQRLLYAKLFARLTSSRRARISNLPHFRLNKVRNIKTWLSVRSYLRKRGPQRSIDLIVSAAFIITLILLAFICCEFLKESVTLNSQYNLEAMCWSVCIGFFLLRFMTLGTQINGKYRNLSVLITEQINLYLKIEQKPHKKEELMVANSVLKLAADLLKELECPFKISGLSANPYMYNITKVVILSALSGVLSELLGFKLKLHKIKI